MELGIPEVVVVTDGYGRKGEIIAVENVQVHTLWVTHEIWRPISDLVPGSYHAHYDSQEPY